MTLLAWEYLEVGGGWFPDPSRLLEGDNAAALIQLLSMNVARKGRSAERFLHLAENDR